MTTAGADDYGVGGNEGGMETKGNLGHMFLSDSTVLLMEACQPRPKSNRRTISRLSQVFFVSFAGHGLDMISVDLCNILETCSFSFRSRFSFSLSGSLFYSLSSVYLFNLLANLLIFLLVVAGDLFWAFSHKSK